MKSRALVPVVAVIGAAGIAGGAIARWWSVRWLHPMLGEKTSTFTGRQVAPALLVIALVAVAGLGAVAAAKGGARRVIGLLVAVAGAMAVVATWSGIAAVPVDRVIEANPQVQRVLAGDRSWVGPVVAGFGGLLVLIAGLLVLAGRLGGRGMGSRFERGTAAGRAGTATRPDAQRGEDSGRSPGTATGDSTGQSADDDARLLWKALDAGDDPTADGRHDR